MTLDELHLWYLADPAQPRYVGTLRTSQLLKGVSLQYAPSWLESGFALSEDLPPVEQEQHPRWKELAVGAVDDARPDRWGERVIRFLDKPRRASVMEFLYYAGDERFGALGVSTSAQEYLPRRNGPLPRLEDAEKLSDVVRKIQDKDPISDIERRLLSTGGTFGGAKPKALIEAEGQQWVLKFSAGEPVDTPLIEHACMTLAAKAGIRVATTFPVRLSTGHAVAVLRYDRQGPVRIHCLSAATVLRAQTPEGQEPEFGYPQLAQLLRRKGVTEGDVYLFDMRELFRRMVFNILVDNTDDHEKNHALQVFDSFRYGQYRLSPAFDVLPTNSGQGHQEFLVGDALRESTLDNALSQCEQFGLRRQDAALEIAGVVEVVNGWKEHFQACGVTAADIESLASFLDDSLGAQRRDFSAARRGAPVPRPRRRGPFSGG